MSRRKNKNNNEDDDGYDLHTNIDYIRSTSTELPGILNTADRHATQGLDLARSAKCSGQSTLQDALRKLMLAAEIYFKVLPNIANQDTRIKIDRGLDKCLKAANTLYEKMVTCNLIKNVPGVSGLASRGTNEQGAADDEIRQKIIDARMTSTCGFRSLDDYAGGQAYKEFLKTVGVDRFRYFNFQKDTINSVMLYGPPGTGKSLMVEGAVEMFQNLGVVYYNVSAATIKGKYSGEAEKSLKILFEMARKDTKKGTKPVIIFIDEIDSLVGRAEGTSAGGAGVEGGVLGVFNAETTAPAGANKGLFLFSATNFPALIPDSVLSRSLQYFVGLPTLDDLRELLISKFSKIGWSSINFSAIDFDRKQYIANAAQIPGMDANPPSKQVTDKLNSLADTVDLMVAKLYADNYAPREIDMIFDEMERRSQIRSTKFIETSSKFTRGEMQLWLYDKKPMKKRDPVSCVLRDVKKSHLIPIGYVAGLSNGRIDWSSENSFFVKEFDDMLDGVTGKLKVLRDGNNVDIQVYPKADPDREIKFIITEKSTTASGAIHFKTIYVQKTPNSLVPEFEPANYSAQNDIGTRIYELGARAQINYVDFEAATAIIKPVRVTNAESLLEFAEAKKLSAKEGQDIERLKQMVEQNRASAPSKYQDSQNVLQLLSFAIANALKTGSG